MPHLQYVGACFFITFNLKGAIPAEVIARLVDEKQLAFDQIKKEGNDAARLYDEHKRHFARVDRILDACQHGPDWLSQPAIASVVKEKLHELDTVHYELLAYCIMSNHVHVVIDMAVQLDSIDTNESVHSRNYTQVFVVLQRIKGGSARIANQLLRRRGAFWQPESYDHYVRNAAELTRIIDYVLQNPVKAGLVDNWEDWPHTYVSERLT